MELKETLRAQLKEISDAPQSLQAEVMELRGEVSIMGIWQQEHVKEIADLRDLPLETEKALRGFRESMQSSLEEFREEIARLGSRLEVQSSQLEAVPRSLQAEMQELCKEVAQVRVKQQAQSAQLLEVQSVQETEGKELRSCVARHSEAATTIARLQEEQTWGLQKVAATESEERGKLRVEVMELLAQELATLRKEVAFAEEQGQVSRKSLEVELERLKEALNDHSLLLENVQGLEEVVKRLDCSHDELVRDFSEYQDDMLLRDRALSAACRSGSGSASLGGGLRFQGRTEQLSQALEAEVATRTRVVADLHNHVRQELADVRQDCHQRCEDLHLRYQDLFLQVSSPSKRTGRLVPAASRDSSETHSWQSRFPSSREKILGANTGQEPEDHLAALRSMFPDKG